MLADSLQLAEDAIERATQRLSVFRRERHGRTDLEDVSVRSFRPAQHAFFTHPVHDVVRLGSRWFERLAILHELDAEEQPAPAYIADEGMLVRKVLQPIEQRVPNLTGMIHEPLVLNHIEGGEASRARHGVPSKRAEELHPGVERPGNRVRRHDRPDRMAVSYRVPEQHSAGTH